MARPSQRRAPGIWSNEIRVGTEALGRFAAEALRAKDFQVRIISRTGRMESPPAGVELIAAENLYGYGKPGDRSRHSSQAAIDKKGAFQDQLQYSFPSI